MKQILLLLLAGIALTLLLTSCETSSQKLAEKLTTSYEYDGKQVVLEGYILPLSFTMIRNDAARIELCKGADASRNRVVITDAAEVNFGKSANSIYFEDNAEANSVEIYDNTGTKLTYEDKIQISGTVQYVAKGPKVKHQSRNKIAQEIWEKNHKEEANKEGDGNNYDYKIVNVTITKL